MGSGDVDVVITDLRMPKVDGMDVLRHAAKHSPHVPVIMITAYGSVGRAVEASKAGAFDYIEKPFELEQMRVVVDTAVKQATTNRAAPRQTPYPLGDATVKGRYGTVSDSP